MKPLNFRTLFISITLFLLQFNSVTAQVALDSAAVNASFYGIFNRTKIELFISNKSNIDNLEYRTRFKINKNAFVDNLLLEIEGELEDGLTVSRESGRKIYEEITGRRIDPAYLVKNSDGSYTLNVFPVNKKQTRRIVIEYFSIPEISSEEQNGSGAPGNWLKWVIKFLRKEPLKKSIVVSSIQPENTLTNFSNLNYKTKTNGLLKENGEEKNFFINDLQKYEIEFNYSETPSTIKYFNDSLFCYTSNRIADSVTIALKDIMYISQYESSPANSIKNLIRNKGDFMKETIHYYNYGEECNLFLADFINYLSDKSSINIKYEEEYYFNPSISWNANGVVFWNDIVLSFYVPDSLLKKEPAGIECPYLINFYNYAKILHEDRTSQKKSGFLYPGLSKIVIEKDSLTQRIASDILENETIRNGTQSTPIFFIAVEEMPEIIGGLDTLQELLFYPYSEKSSSSDQRIYIKGVVNKTGVIICTDEIKSSNRTLTQIGKLALTLVPWKPGKQRGKPVTVTMSVPLNFHSGLESEKTIKIEDRIYKSKMLENRLLLLEDKFNFPEAEEIDFRSAEFFDFLHSNPELLIAVYKVLYLSELDGLGFVLSREDHKKFVLINR